MVSKEYLTNDYALSRDPSRKRRLGHWISIMVEDKDIKQQLAVVKQANVMLRSAATKYLNLISLHIAIHTHKIRMPLGDRTSRVKCFYNNIECY